MRRHERTIERQHLVQVQAEGLQRVAGLLRQQLVARHAGKKPGELAAVVVHGVADLLAQELRVLLEVLQQPLGRVELLVEDEEPNGSSRLQQARRLRRSGGGWRIGPLRPAASARRRRAPPATTGTAGSGGAARSRARRARRSTARCRSRPRSSRPAARRDDAPRSAPWSGRQGRPDRAPAGTKVLHQLPDAPVHASAARTSAI